MTRRGTGATSGSTDRLWTPAFITLTLAELTYFTAVGVMIPTTPLFASRSLGAGAFEVGLVVGAFSVAALVLRPWAGRLSDRRGRRPLLIGGAALFAMITLAHIPASDLLVLVGLRFMLGVAEAFFFVAGVAALADLAPAGREGEAASYNSLALYLGIAFGPLIGEILIDIGGFDAAWTGAAILAIVTAMIAFRLPETWRAPTAAASAGASRAAFFYRGAIGPGLALFAGVAAMAGFMAFVAIRAQDIGMEGARLVLLVFGLSVVVVRTMLAKLPDRVPPLRLAAAALGLTAAGMLVASLSSEVGLVAGAAISGIGVAFLTPAIFAYLIVNAAAAERGAAMGTASVFIDLAFGGGPLIFGAVAAVAGIPAAFVAGALIAAVGAIGTILVAAPRDRAGTTSP